jgi:hypothetical protein
MPSSVFTILNARPDCFCLARLHTTQFSLRFARIRVSPLTCPSLMRCASQLPFRPEPGLISHAWSTGILAGECLPGPNLEAITYCCPEPAEVNRFLPRGFDASEVLVPVLKTFPDALSEECRWRRNWAGAIVSRTYRRVNGRRWPGRNADSRFTYASCPQSRGMVPGQRAGSWSE